MKRYALIGNPNAGKTTLFNELTGTNQHVGNWPGVTVEQKTGRLRRIYGAEAEIIDLPGIYSLSPHSIEERVSRSYIIDEKPDVVIDVLEATNIERNLFLTCEIAELGVPMVVAINMMDEAERVGDRIDTEKLSEMLGLPVVPISAVKGDGVIELMHVADGSRQLLETVNTEASQLPHPGYNEHGHGFEDTEDPEEHIRDHHTDEDGRTNALIAHLKYHNHYRGPKVKQALDNSVLSDADEADNARRRYEFIDGLIAATVHKGKQKDHSTTSDKIDRVVTHPVFGIPIFLLIMWFMFHCTFSNNFLFLGIPSPGVWLQELMQDLVSWVSASLSPLFTPGGWAYSLVIDGIIGGVGAVLSFLPQICVLFFFLTLLEDVGYMSRAAFIMDRLMRSFGLSGKSFLPMIMGFGCNVPAMMACRTMENENDRKMTLFLIPFMSCGARAPIFLVFSAAFFPDHTDVVVFSLYLISILIAVLVGLFLKHVVFKGEVTPLIIELPRYRAPKLKSLGLALGQTIKDYIVRAGTIIFAMSVVVWFLSSFSPSLQLVASIDDSILAVAGRFISPVFVPLGFGFWTAAVALLSGFAAKEAVVGTMGVLYGVGGDTSGSAGGFSTAVLAAAGFTPLSSLSFMVFVLLYTPCAATLATLRRESNSRRWTLLQLGTSLVVAWICSFAVFQIGGLLGLA